MKVIPCANVARRDTRNIDVYHCEKPVCNICSRNVHESIPGYDEENKRVGICQSCDSVSRISFTTLCPPHAEPCYESEEKSDLSDDKIILVSQNYFSSVAEPPRKKQKRLVSRFLSSSQKDKHKSDKMVGVVKSCSKKNPKQHSKCQPVDKLNERTVSVSTMEGWDGCLSCLS